MVRRPLLALPELAPPELQLRDAEVSSLKRQCVRVLEALLVLVVWPAMPRVHAYRQCQTAELTVKFSPHMDGRLGLFLHVDGGWPNAPSPTIRASALLDVTFPVLRRVDLNPTCNPHCVMQWCGWSSRACVYASVDCPLLALCHLARSARDPARRLRQGPGMGYHRQRLMRQHRLLRRHRVNALPLFS